MTHVKVEILENRAIKKSFTDYLLTEWLGWTRRISILSDRFNLTKHECGFNLATRRLVCLDEGNWFEMMNISKISKLTLAAITLAAAPMTANAATVTITVLNASGDGSTGSAANTADIYAGNYGANTPLGGATMDGNTAIGSSSFVYRSPWDGTSKKNLNTFFAVGPAPNTPNPATLTFGGAQTTFTMLWGSIDSYNEMTFGGLGSGDPAVTITGSDVASQVNSFAAGTCNSPANYQCTALLSFTVTSGGAGDTFSNLSFYSDGAQAFEFATAPVPLPATGFLLFAGLGGLAALKRRKKAA